MRYIIVRSMKFKYESKIIEFLILSILKSTGSMQTVIKILDDMAKFSETAQRIITELNHMIVNNFFSKENNLNILKNLRNNSSKF